MRSEFFYLVLFVGIDIGTCISVFFSKEDIIFEIHFFLINVECTMSFLLGPLGALKKQKRLFTSTKRLFYVIFISYILKRCKFGLHKNLFPEETFWSLGFPQCFGCLFRRFGCFKRQLCIFDGGLCIVFKNTQKVIEKSNFFGPFDFD